MVLSMTSAPENRPDPTAFTATWGPVIVIATIVLPALIAGWLASKQRARQDVLTADAGAGAGREAWRSISSIARWSRRWSSSSAGWAGRWC